MDPLGTALLMGTVISFILALQYGGATHPWNSSVVIGLLVGFVLMLIAFGILEMVQGERAMLTPRLMRQRNVWVNGVYGFFFAGSYFVPLYYLPIYFQSIDNVSPTASGVRSIPLIIAFSIATVVSGGSISKTGIATPYLPVGSVLTTIAVGLLYTLDIGTSTGKWIGYQIFAGAGYGLAFQVPIIVAQGTADPSDLASSTAIILCELSYALSYDLVSPLYPLLQANRAPRPQSSKPLAAHFSLEPRNPASSIGSCTSFPVPHRASMGPWSWAPEPVSCAKYSRQTS